MKEPWGLCKDCKWWQIEPDASVQNTTMGLCIDEEIQPYQIRVSGNSGCNRFMGGKPAALPDPPTNRPPRNQFVNKLSHFFSISTVTPGALTLTFPGVPLAARHQHERRAPPRSRPAKGCLGWEATSCSRLRKINRRKCM